MKNEDLKEALLSERPVKSGDIEYKCISAIIYRKQDNAICVKAELLDRCGHSISIADPKKITYVEDKNQGIKEAVKCLKE